MASDSSPNHTLLICSKCRGAEGAARLRADLAPRLPRGFGLRAVECMAGCDRPTTVGFQARGKATYLFGDIDGTEDIQAIADFAHQYANSDHGWTSASHRPEALYRKTLARLPAIKDGRSQ